MEVRRIQIITGFVLLLLIAADAFFAFRYLHGFTAIALFALTLFVLLYALGVLSNILIFVRLKHIALKRLDPEQLRREMDQHFQKDKQRDTDLYYLSESTLYELLGEYGKSLECLLKKEFRQPKAARAVKACLAYLYARTGDMATAESYLPYCEKLLKASSGEIRAGCLHTMGYIHMSRNEFPAARQCFEEVLRLGTSKFASLNAHFDLACLEEKEGDRESAIAHYRRAAEIGPKTWMGQEAARRLFEYGVKLNDSVYYSYIIRNM